MNENISLNGIKRIGQAETEIAKLQTAGEFVQRDVKEIKGHLSEIFKKMNRMEVRLAILFVIISVAIKYLPKIPT